MSELETANFKCVVAEVELLRAENASLGEALATCELDNHKLRALVVHAAACNPEATGENAAIALRQIVKHARAALGETK